MIIKRYDIHAYSNEDGGFADADESKDGEWVRYIDVEPLVLALERIAKFDRDVTGGPEMVAIAKAALKGS